MKPVVHPCNLKIHAISYRRSEGASLGMSIDSQHGDYDSPLPADTANGVDPGPEGQPLLLNGDHYEGADGLRSAGGMAGWSPVKDAETRKTGRLRKVFLVILCVCAAACWRRVCASAVLFAVVSSGLFLRAYSETDLSHTHGRWS